MVKPALGMSSLGVTRVDSGDALGAVVTDVRRVSAGTADGGAGLIVEEYLDGPEFAVESLVHEGRVQVLSIGYKGDPRARTSRRASTGRPPRCPRPSGPTSCAR